MSESRRRFQLPQIKGIVLRNFSLFTKMRVISLELSQGVFCLAGANGLGKSTFISAVNYALTGRVINPRLRFASVEEYYRQSRDYSQRFFSGRILEADRDAAEISLTFDVGDIKYEITRGFFEPDQLRNLEINPGGRDIDVASLETGVERQDAYANHLAAQIGLERFDQFVFLQLFLLTFDERRHLAFWDPTVLQQMLMLGFGFDAKVARQADNLRREFEKQDSLVRNRNWQATEAAKRLADLESLDENASEIDPEVESRYLHWTSRRDELNHELTLRISESHEAESRLGRLGSFITVSEQQYERLFAEGFGGSQGLTPHPTLQHSITHQRCAVCGAQSQSALQSIHAKLSDANCYLCGTTIQRGDHDSDDRLDQLKVLDDQIQIARDQLSTTRLTLERLATEQLEIKRELDPLTKQIGELEQESELIAISLRRGSSDQLTRVAES